MATVQRGAGLVPRLLRRLEQVWLRRWYLASRMKATRLNVRLDTTTVRGEVRANAELAFVPAVSSHRTTCLIGDVDLQAVTWKGKPVTARVNPPYLVLSFPGPIRAGVEQVLQVRYTYSPDQYGTLLQPTTREDCPERVWISCRRPLLALVQGRLVQGTETPPMRTYEWTPPRSRKLNVVTADVRSFRKETSEGMAMWLHLHAESEQRAPRILDLLLAIHDEAAQSHHRKLPYSDFHVVESDSRDVPAFDSAGLIVVPRGTFDTDDRPSVYGILAPEFNKEWARDPTWLVSEGTKD